MTVTIKYGDTTFYCEGEHADVCKAIANGDALEVYRYSKFPPDLIPTKIRERITFFGDPDWVSVAV